MDIRMFEYRKLVAFLFLLAANLLPLESNLPAMAPSADSSAFGLGELTVRRIVLRKSDIRMQSALLQVCGY